MTNHTLTLCMRDKNHYNALWHSYEWCEENLSAHPVVEDHEDGRYTLTFANDDDKALFALRWIGGPK